MPLILWQCIGIGWPWIPKLAELTVKFMEVALDKEIVFHIVNGWLMPV